MQSSGAVSTGPSGVGRILRFGCGEVVVMKQLVDPMGTTKFVDRPPAELSCATLGRVRTRLRLAGWSLYLSCQRADGAIKCGSTLALSASEFYNDCWPRVRKLGVIQNDFCDPAKYGFDPSIRP